MKVPINPLSSRLSIQGSGGPVLLLLACVLAQAFPHWLLFDRIALSHGQLWRLITSHIVHSNDAHLLLNAGALVALWLIHGQHYQKWSFLRLSAGLSLAISLGLWFFFSEVQLYCGLSGVLHGLFCWAAMKDMLQGRQLGALLLIGCFVKVGWELIFGASALTAAVIEAEVAVSSHLLGTILGTLIGLLRMAQPAQEGSSSAY